MAADPYETDLWPVQWAIDTYVCNKKKNITNVNKKMLAI